MKIKNQKAFSLIEIPLLILIIGILISGVSQGIDLYGDYRLKSAQNLTKNSQVNRIPDLEIWLKTTLENSFALGTNSFVDKITPNELDPIGRWNEANPNILPTARNSSTQASLGSQPLYYSKSINGLPALKFDGINDGLFFNGNFLVGVNYTIFVVEKRTSGKINNYFLSGSNNTPNSNLHLGYRNNYTLTQAHYNSDLNKTIPSFNDPINTIHSFVFSKSDGKAFYTNGGGKALYYYQLTPL